MKRVLQQARGGAARGESVYCCLPCCPLLPCLRHFQIISQAQLPWEPPQASLPLGKFSSVAAEIAASRDVVVAVGPLRRPLFFCGFFFF